MKLVLTAFFSLQGTVVQIDSTILLREQLSFLLPRGLQEHQTPADATDSNSHRLPFVWCAHVLFFSSTVIAPQ